MNDCMGLPNVDAKSLCKQHPLSYGMRVYSSRTRLIAMSLRAFVCMQQEKCRGRRVAAGMYVSIIYKRQNSPRNPKKSSLISLK